MIRKVGGTKALEELPEKPLVLLKKGPAANMTPSSGEKDVQQ